MLHACCARNSTAGWRDFGLTRSQWLALTRIYRQSGCTQSELAETMEMEKGSAGRLIDRLEKSGFVVRVADRADRRVKRIHLTRKAEAIERSMRTIALETIHEALSDLDEAEHDKAIEVLITVKARLQEMLQNSSQTASAADRQMAAQ